MTARIARLSSALFVAAAFTASAHAEYRCDSPQTWVDRDACKAAEQSPTALRRFVENMNTIRYQHRVLGLRRCQDRGELGASSSGRSEERRHGLEGGQ